MLHRAMNVLLKVGVDEDTAFGAVAIEVIRFGQRQRTAGRALLSYYDATVVAEMVLARLLHTKH